LINKGFLENGRKCWDRKPFLY